MVGFLGKELRMFRSEERPSVELLSRNGIILIPQSPEGTAKDGEEHCSSLSNN